MATRTDRLRIRLETDGEGRTRASLGGVEQGIERIDRQGRRTERTLFSMRNALATLGVAAVARSTIQTIVQFEKLGASLRTVTGSSEAATRAFDGLKQFATETPFQLQEIVDGFIKLKALGLDPSREALESYGNTASAMGKSLNQFIEAVADAATGEFERLKEFGIRASQQGDEVSFTFQGVTTTVRKNAEEIEGYLREIGRTEFAGAMEQQMDTLGGAFSNLQDAAAQLAAAIGEAGLSSALQAAADILGDFSSALTAAVSPAEQNARSASSLTKGYKVFTFTVFKLKQEFEDLGDVIGATAQIAASIGPGFGDALDTILAERQRKREQLEQETETFVARLNGIYGELEDPPLPTGGDTGGGSGGGGGDTGGGSGGGGSTKTRKTFGELLGALELQNRSVRANLEGWAELEEQITAVETVSQRLGRQLTDSEAQAVRDAVAERQRLSEALNENEEAYRSTQEQQREMQRLLRSTIDAVDPTAELTRELERLDELMRSDIGEGFGDVILERMLQINIEMDKLGEKTEEKAEEMSEFAKQAARNMQDSLADFLFDPFDDGLEGMVAGFSNTLRRMAAEQASAQLFDSVGGTEGVGGFLSDFIGGLNIPGFANGTNFAPGGLAWVGERGRELVNLPRGSEVIPNNKLPGVGTTNVFNVNVTGDQAERNRQSGGQLARDIARNLERGARRNG